MMQLAYNVSPEIKTNLQSIESFRRQILLTPLSPRSEIRLRWESMVNRIYFTHELSGEKFDKSEVIKLLQAGTGQKLGSKEKIIGNLKRAFDYISYEWFASSKQVSPRSVVSLYEMIFQGRLVKSESQLGKILDYIQVNPESPVIQAGIVQVELLGLSPFSQGNGRLARILAYLFLYKGGYDFKGLLVLEEFWRSDLLKFRSILSEAVKTGNLTLWLEYFSETVMTQLEKVSKNLKAEKYQIDTPTHIWELNDRQREIISFLNEPGKTITNRRVQNLFKVSQITASRDLAKLSQLSLIFPKGRGRSVSYIKI